MSSYIRKCSTYMHVCTLIHRCCKSCNWAQTGNPRVQGRWSPNNLVLGRSHRMGSFIGISLRGPVRPRAWHATNMSLLWLALAVSAPGSICSAPSTLDPLGARSTSPGMSFGTDAPPAPISAVILRITGGRRGAEVRMRTVYVRARARTSLSRVRRSIPHCLASAHADG